MSASIPGFTQSSPKSLCMEEQIFWGKDQTQLHPRLNLWVKAISSLTNYPAGFKRIRIKRNLVQVKFQAGEALFAAGL